MNEEVMREKSAAALDEGKCIFCLKIGCAELISKPPGPDAGHARMVFHRARIVEDEAATEGTVRHAHGVCPDCLAIEGSMNEAYMEAMRILMMTASLEPNVTIATMSFLAHLISDGIENLDTLQDRLVSSKPLFHVLFPVLPPPSAMNPSRGRSGFDLAVAHILASLLVQHSVPVACMAIMLVMHAKAYESGENLETLQDFLRWGKRNFLSVKGMLAEAQNADARSATT